MLLPRRLRECQFSDERTPDNTEFAQGVIEEAKVSAKEKLPLAKRVF